MDLVRSADSNPGAATPKSLFDMYVKHAAMTGNPYTMRTLASERGSVDEHQPLLKTLDGKMGHRAAPPNSKQTAPKTAPRMGFNEPPKLLMTVSDRPPARGGAHMQPCYNSDSGSTSGAELAIRNAVRAKMASDAQRHRGRTQVSPKPTPRAPLTATGIFSKGR